MEKNNDRLVFIEKATVAFYSAALMSNNSDRFILEDRSSFLVKRAALLWDAIQKEEDNHVE